MHRLLSGLEKQYEIMAEVIMFQKDPYLPHSSKFAVLQAMQFCYFPTQVTVIKLPTNLINSLIQQKTSTSKNKKNNNRSQTVVRMREGYKEKHEF